MNAFARLLLCTALSGLALGAQARTFEVSDFAELDDAVIEAEDGDEIVIKKGVYELEAPLEIFSRVTVRGEQGVGLGLYLAREIAAANGGYIKVASRLGEGSTFSLFLPKA